MLQCTPTAVQEQIVFEVNSSEFFALMIEESTDVAVLKQLVVVVRYPTQQGIKTLL